MFAHGDSVKKRVKKAAFFKGVCGVSMVIYIAIIGLFISLILKSGLDAFMVTLVRVDSASEVELLEDIIANNAENAGKIEAINASEAPYQWLLAKGNFGYYYKSKKKFNEEYNEIISELKAKKAIKKRLSLGFLTNTDSSSQESAGLLGAIMGTLLVTAVFLSFASIIGIGAGIYLAEFARSRLLKNIISINISNLASIPPIIYGVFGINFLINTLELPRSSSLLGGLILGLLTLPIVIITATDSLNSVPSHLKFSAKALGLTKNQTVLRVCLPYAFPRILTGVLLTLSRGVSEATPLIIIGMASFIQAPPQNFTQPATTIATQIYLWVNSPDSSFIEKAYGSILVLLVIIGFINLVASVIRHKVLKRTNIR